MRKYRGDAPIENQLKIDKLDQNRLQSIEKIQKVSHSGVGAHPAIQIIETPQLRSTCRIPSSTITIADSLDHINTPDNVTHITLPLPSRHPTWCYPSAGIEARAGPGFRAKGRELVSDWHLINHLYSNSHIPSTSSPRRVNIFDPTAYIQNIFDSKSFASVCAQACVCDDSRFEFQVRKIGRADGKKSVRRKVQGRCTNLAN
jgi:hypothetical protein